MIDYFASACPACRSITARSASTTTSTTASSAPEAGHGLARARRGCSLPAPVHGSPGQDLDLRPALARQADPERALPERGGLRARPRARAEPRAAGAGPGRRHRSPDRRALLLGLPRGPAAGRIRADQRDGRRRRRATITPAHLLRQSLRQAVVGGQLPLSLPGHPRGAASISSRSSSRGAAKRTCSCSRSSICRSASASASSTSRRTTSRAPAIVAERIRRRSRSFRPSGSAINPDCGLSAPAPRRRVRQALRHGRRHAASSERNWAGEQSPRRARSPPGAFCYIVELVASGLKREAQVLEIASKLAMMPEIVAGSITSYAGGALGQDPMRVGTAVRARGLTPNVHLTCVSQDRQAHREDARATLHALEMHNVFALTGDWPKAQRRRAAGRLRPRLGAARAPHRRAAPRRACRFHSPSPSRRSSTSRGLLYQYLKLEKKIAAGADLAITQVGWDATKFVELKRYLDERGIDTPVLGNVYVLGPTRRRADGDGPARPAAGSRPTLLEAVRAGSRRRRTAGCARVSSGRPGRSRCSKASATPAPTSAARTMPATSRGSSGARRSWRRGGKRWPRSCSSEIRRLLSVRPAPQPRRRARASRGPSASCRGSST